MIFLSLFYPFIRMYSFVHLKFVSLVACVTTAAAHKTFWSFQSAMVNSYMGVQVGF